ncbi:MAG: hypothetical protein FD141_779 [Fusobacteria bacterium]|nr:MAG: hypothetical protein FD141_779 [Fusobacteriota bacterium]KAF0228555.1 MAG: hypothetical protein FD182_811 [Fusobacteriota bacterium]
MKKKVFFIVLGLIILSTLRFYYIECERGFDQAPTINTKENTVNFITKVD